MKSHTILSPGQTIRQYTGDESQSINHAPAPETDRGEIGATEAL
jgi:hypothetical protein